MGGVVEKVKGEGRGCVRCESVLGCKGAQLFKKSTGAK